MRVRIIFLYLSFLMAQVAYSGAHRNLIVVIDPYFPGSKLASEDQMARQDFWYANNLLDQYPGATVVRIHKFTNSEIRKELEKVIKPGDEVAALMINSEGATHRLFNTLRLDNEDFDIQLDNKKSVESAFGPLVGKFKENAKIISNGCDVIPEEDPQEIFSVMTTIASAFQLRTGFLYLNKTAGAVVPPPNNLTGNLIEKVVDPIFDFTIDPIGGLISITPFVNQGFSLRLNNGKAQLFRDNLWRAGGEWAIRQDWIEKAGPSVTTTTRKIQPSKSTNVRGDRSTSSAVRAP